MLSIAYGLGVHFANGWGWKVMAYGLPDGHGQSEKLWECLDCEGTYTETVWKLKQLGWRIITLKSGETVVLCPDCKPSKVIHR